MGAIKCSVQEGGELGEKIMAYDAEVLERGSAEIKISLNQSLTLHDWDKFITSPLVTVGLSRLHPKS